MKRNYYNKPALFKKGYIEEREKIAVFLYLFLGYSRSISWRVAFGKENLSANSIPSLSSRFFNQPRIIEFMSIVERVYGDRPLTLNPDYYQSLFK